MKKLTSLLVAGVFFAASMSSCMIYEQRYTTGGPVGKTGVSKGMSIATYPGTNGLTMLGTKFSLETAAKNGGIERIGAVDVTVKWFIFPFYKVVISGE